MRTTLLVVMAFLVGIAVSCAAPTPTPTPTATPTLPPAPPVVSVKLDVGVGAPPSEGWKWAVAGFNTGTQEVSEGPHAHDYAWVFFTVRGSAEVSTADGKKLFAAGEGVLIPAGQQHSHRHLPQSEEIAFHLRRADDPPVSLHRGTTLLVSDKALEIRAGSDYKLRIREFTFAAGSQTSESLTSDPNFGYLEEGTLTFTVGQTVKTVEAGKPFVLPLTEKYVISNQSTKPLRFLLVDVRP